MYSHPILVNRLLMTTVRVILKTSLGSLKVGSVKKLWGQKQQQS